ncbi:hypothetical protein [Roseibium polysiphoniae]|uniref:Uncharacterized protein n=1 Tax=Roseibium polysiphoniae TaxID=2571221 RepID=A0ABR9C6F0_9HYPH|nr:hypothetical protein [Roseibium polysiphoniae]MBD8875455.1 hypothetical protein [Roseibium polysiphoniae]
MSSHLRASVLSLALGLGFCLMGAVPAAEAETRGLTPALVEAMKVPPQNLASLSCRRLWYLEHKVLAAGRVCLSTDRARRAFGKALPCISDEERILPERVRDYLTGIRRAQRVKSCPVD